ncbi:MAG: DUF362 domain-containing protein [Acidobacteria bacterium]|nr:DUF362 domain-containing protein [Acidobacteriota bacterium]
MKTQLNNLTVAIVSGAKQYALEPPFHPPEIFPEYPHAELQVDPTNQAYAMVRESFRLLGLDKENFGAKTWNPLGELVSRHQRVLIKPNFVLHFNASGGAWEAVTTHPSVLRAIADYVAIALDGSGEIMIGDAPQMNCDWPTLMKNSGMDRLAKYLREAFVKLGVKVTTHDFRKEQTVYQYGIIWERVPQQGVESVAVTLGAESFMEAIDSQRLYGADYNRRATIAAHRHHQHEYLIAKPVLQADVVISVPKLKVHRKVGTTLNLKNMVGINTDKNHLAHYRIGAPASGGDEMANPTWQDRAERRLMDIFLGRNWRIGRYPFVAWRAFRKALAKFQTATATPKFTYGNWHGNDTAWRMTLDLNHALLFADAEGRLQSTPVRKYFSVIDGIIGGEGEGPLHPEAYASGVIVAGFNPVAVDWTATRLMGFNPARISLYNNAVVQMRGWFEDFAIDKISVQSNRTQWQSLLHSDANIFTFRAAAGWQGKIEQHAPSNEATEPAAPSMILQ